MSVDGGNSVDSFIEEIVDTPIWSEAFVQSIDGYIPKGKLEQLSSSDGNDTSLLPTYVVGDSTTAKVCMLILPDEYGYQSGRHQLIADEFAIQFNYLVVMPDLFRGTPPMNSNKTEEEDGIEVICEKYKYSQVKDDLVSIIYPYCRGGLGLEARKVVCLGFSYGAYLWTFLAAEPNCRFVACSAPHASIIKICKATKVDKYKKAFAKFKCPIQLLNCTDDSEDQKSEGTIQNILYEVNGLPPSEFHSQFDVNCGWSIHGNVENDPIVREATQAVYEHIQRFFQKHTKVGTPPDRDTKRNSS